MTPEEFVALFPEFVGADEDLVQSRLTWAEARTPVDVWGDLQEEGVGLLAAHMLALTPAGRELRLADSNGETLYSKERKYLNMVVSSGYRVADTALGT